MRASQLPVTGTVHKQLQTAHTLSKRILQSNYIFHSLKRVVTNSHKMLSAIGNAVHAVQDTVQEVTGIGKGDNKSEQQDTQQQEVDQSPAGEDESSPEFTTTSKETLPSGKETVTTTKDDVRVPDADKDTTTTRTDADVSTKDQDQDASADTPQPSTKDSKASKPAAKDAKPTAAAPTESKSTPSAASTKSEATPTPTPTAAQESSGPLNKLRNMGGGSQRMPSTPKKWKKDGSSWHPDAAGIHYPPGFFINKRRMPTF